MTCRTMHSHVSVTVLVELAWFFKLEIRLALLMTALTFGFINPWASIRVSDHIHVAMAVLTENALGEVNIPLTIGLEARMT